MAQILVVDDDAAIRETLRLLFEDAGYEVAEASDGVAALAALRSSARPMVVLLDLMMPRMNGHQVLAAVAQDERLAAFHVYITVTACPRARLGAIGQAGAQLAIPHIEKPFDIDEVLGLVEREVERLAQRAAASMVDVCDAALDVVGVAR